MPPRFSISQSTWLPSQPRCAETSAVGASRRRNEVIACVRWSSERSDGCALHNKKQPRRVSSARAVIMLRANVVGNCHDAPFFFDVTSDITRTFQTSGPTGEQAQTTHRTDTDKQKRGAGPRLLRRATLQDQVGKKSALLPSRRQAQSKHQPSKTVLETKLFWRTSDEKSQTRSQCNKVLRH